MAQTAAIAKKYGVIKSTPTGATNYTYARKALAQLKAAGVNTTGATWRKLTVKVTAGK